MRCARWIPCVLAGVLLIGCAKKKEEQAKVEPPAPPPQEVLMQQVGELLQAGRTNDATALLDKAVDNPLYAPVRPAVFSESIRFRIWAGDPAGAQAAFLARASNDVQLAAQAVGIVEGYLAQAGQFDKLTAWCETLAPLDFPKPVQARLLDFLAEGYRSQGLLDRVLDVYARAVQSLPPDTAQAVVNNSLNALLAGAQYADLDRALDFVAARFADRPVFPQMVTVLRIRSLVAQGQLDAAGSLLEAKLASLDDATAAGLLETVARKAQETDRLPFVDALCVKVMDARTPQEQAFRAATRFWIATAQTQKNPALILERLHAVSDRKAPDGLLVYLINPVFYYVCDQGEMPLRKDLLQLCQTVRSRVASAGDKELLTGMILDGCFMVENFELAEQLVSNEMPDMEPAQKAILLPKIKAHRALQAGKKEEAIGFFREFMARTAGGDESLVDPISGMRITREYILGLNAARIAELWASLGQKEKAEAAYAEARASYGKALGKTPANTDEYRDVQKKLQALPGGSQAAQAEPAAPPARQNPADK